MSRLRSDSLILVLLGSALFLCSGFACEAYSRVSMLDFRSVYYGARCLLLHGDPYKQRDLQNVYIAEGGKPELETLGMRNTVVRYVNLPTAFTFIVPFAILPWGPAHYAWMLVTAASLILAAFLMWELGAEYAPVISGVLLCLFLAGRELLLEVGNTAGIAVSLCVIAAWCFLRGRFERIGILCLAVSLVIKPHDSGLVWLYFLLAGGLYRKRALQTLLVTVVLSMPAILWVSQVSPDWMQELHSNLAATSARGEGNDPGPAAVDPRAHGAIIISLQSAISVFDDNPRIYNLATYLLCLPLLALWVRAASRKPSSCPSGCFALAAIAALSMLPLYHRQHDTSLLLLTFPACAMLWVEGGVLAWSALLLTAASAVLTSNISLEILAQLTFDLRQSTSGMPGQFLTLILARPAPLILLTLGSFYLWVYVRRFAVRGAAG